MRVDPQSLSLRIHPDPVLREKAGHVPEPSENLREVVARMVRIMRESEGIGLAAPQVGLGWRVFVAHLPADDTEPAHAPDVHTSTPTPTAYIDPRIVSAEGHPEPYEEGCLSLPEIRGDVLRPPTVTMRALDIDGNEVTLRSTGLLARCWQHEIDHLDGVLIIDKMTALGRRRNRNTLRDLEQGAR